VGLFAVVSALLHLVGFMFVSFVLFGFCVDLWVVLLLDRCAVA